MSFFRSEQTEMTDRECLVGGLEDMGLDSKKLEVRNEPRKLVGWGDASAEIVLKKGAVGNKYEIGFRKNKAGSYDLICADDDRFELKTVKRAYAERKGIAMARAKGMKFVRKVTKTVDGKVNTKLVFQAASN